MMSNSGKESSCTSNGMFPCSWNGAAPENNDLVSFFQHFIGFWSTSCLSRDLRGKVFTDPSDLSSCDPIITGPNGRIYHPCGLIAWSVFNDTFTFQKDDQVIPSVLYSLR